MLSLAFLASVFCHQDFVVSDNTPFLSQWEEHSKDFWACRFPCLFTLVIFILFRFLPSLSFSPSLSLFLINSSLFSLQTGGNFVCACANLWLSEPWLAFLQREMFNVYIFCTKFSWLSWFLLASVENENCVQPPFIGYSKINGNYFNDKMEFKCEESSSSRDLNGNKTIKTFSSIRFLRYIMEISMHVISIYWY